MDAEESHISYRVVEQLSYKGKAERVETVQTGEENAPGCTFQYLKEAYKKDRTRSFNRSCGTRTGIGFKIEEVQFRLDINTKVL